MKIEHLDRHQLEGLIKDVLAEKLQEMGKGHRNGSGGVVAVALPKVQMSGADRLDTGNSSHRVYTKDVLTLSQSPRLGCGMMEMRDTTFAWHLDYDEIDYIIEGTLTIIIHGERVTAHAGECIFIPKGADIQFSVEGFARFMYVTYPADWQNAADS